MPCKYPLVEIQKIIKEVMAEVTDKEIWFSARSRSVDKVVEVFRGTSKRMTQEQAMLYIYESICELKSNDFSEQVYISDWQIVVDIYGLKKDRIPWYIKFCMENDTLNEISFHPLEKNLKLENGTLLSKEIDL